MMHKRRKTFKPRMETLEDRSCPSPPAYSTPINLGTLGGAYSWALGMNNPTGTQPQMVVGLADIAGSTAGFTYPHWNPDGDVVPGQHAFLWQNGAMTDLGTLPGGSYSGAYAVNNSGQVVGMSDTASGAVHAFLWQNGTMTDLSPNVDTSSRAGAFAINDLGQVVGIGPDGLELWQNGVMTGLSSLLPANSGWTLYSANGINDSGQITGRGDLGTYLFNLNTDVITKLNSSPTEGYAVNAAGQVVGKSVDPVPNSPYVPTLWANGTRTELGPTAAGGIAFGINNNSSPAVVGFSQGATAKNAFLWQGGTFSILYNLIPANSAWIHLGNATGINDADAIIGNGNYAGYTHAFLMTTAPSFAVSGFPSSVTAGTTAAITVTALNADGSVNTGYSGTAHFTSSDPHATLPTDSMLTNGTGTFNVTLVTAGTQSITATDASNSLTGSETGITVNPAAATQFVITGPASIASGTSFSITVRAEDAYGNTATGYTGTIHFSNSVIGATLPGNYTFKSSDKGVHTFSGVKLKTKGTNVLSVADTANASISGSSTVTVT